MPGLGARKERYAHVHQQGVPENAKWALGSAIFYFLCFLGLSESGGLHWLGKLSCCGLGGCMLQGGEGRWKPRVVFSK